MATVDYIHHLAFPKLRDAEAKHLAGMATICDFKDGELVFQVGRRGLPLDVVESGAIAAVDESDDEPVTVAVHGPREFTGDVSLLTDRPATTSGYARGETRAYRVDQGELRRAIQEIPDLSDKLLEAFQARRNMLEHSGFVGVRLLGRLGDPAVTEIREFFDKNKVPHTWVDTDTPDGKTAMDKLDVAPDQLPFVACPLGSRSPRPTVARLAECLELKRPIRGEPFYLVIVGAGGVPGGLERGGPRQPGLPPSPEIWRRARRTG
jgi:thioredoxin reductase (NADPH)